MLKEEMFPRLFSYNWPYKITFSYQCILKISLLGTTLPYSNGYEKMNLILSCELKKYELDKVPDQAKASFYLTLKYI